MPTELIEIAAYIDQFYNSAFTKLLAVGGVFAVVIPVVYWFFQRTWVRKDTDKITAKIAEAESKIEEAEARTQELLEEKTKELEAKIVASRNDSVGNLIHEMESRISQEVAKLDKRFQVLGDQLERFRDEAEKNLHTRYNQAAGAVYLVQANFLRRSGGFGASLESGINGVNCFLESGDMDNLEKCLDMINQSVGRVRDRADYSDRVRQLIRKVKALREQDRFDPYLVKIEQQLNKA